MSDCNIYSLQAEQAILGGLLLNNAVWVEVSEQLHFKDFYKLEHQILFQLFSKKIEQNKSVDALTLSEEVKHISSLKEINGEMYVFELLNKTYSTANIATYIALVKEYSQKRKFKQLITHLNENVDAGEIKTLMQMAHKEFAQIELTSLPATHGVLYQLFSDIYPKSIQWLWPQQIARGKVSIIAGNPGLGKSQITAYLAAIVTTGGTWPVDGTRCEQGGVIFLSAEDDPADTIRPRLEAAGADLSKTYILKSVSNHNQQGKASQRTFNLKTDLPNLEKLLIELNDIALLVIDPITAYLGGTDSYNNAEVRALMMPLSELAAKYNVSILAISHLNKSSGQDPLLRVAGSLAFVAAARSAFIVAADPNDKKRRLLLPAKNNLANDKGGFAFSVQSCLLEESQISTSKVVWEKEIVDEDAYDIMKHQADPEDHTLLKEAVDFLSDQLAFFPKSVSKLKKEANDYGLSWRTTLRAKTTLKIITKKSGMNEGWMWSLPEKEEISEECQTKTLASFEEVGLLRQNLNNFEDKNGNIGQNLLKETKSTEECQTKTLASFEELGLLRQNLNNSEDENGNIGQNLLKEAKSPEGGQLNCRGSFGQDGRLRQDLNDFNRPQEENGIEFEVGYE